MEDLMNQSSPLRPKQFGKLADIIGIKRILSKGSGIRVGREHLVPRVHLWTAAGLQLEQMTSVKGQPLTRKRGQKVACILTACVLPAQM